MNALNYMLVIVGLALIALFWNRICPADRKRETRIVGVVMLCLGVVVYYLQSTFA